MTARRTLLHLLAALGCLLALAAPAGAAAPRASLPDIEDEVLCVTCGIPLNVSEAPAADRQREEIRRLVDRGLTKDQVKAELVSIYGERVLAVPSDSGTGRVGWLLPLAGILAAFVGLGAALWTWRRRREPRRADDGPGGTDGIPDADARRLEADLARYD